MRKKSFAVFGLGRFGGTIVKEFYKMGVEVIAIDKDEAKVNEFSKYATYAVCLDVIDETTINSLGIRNVDHAFVSFGDNLQTSILTSLILKEIGIPVVWVKAQNDYHSKVLKKIGVDRVIHPERDVARRIAHHIVSEKMIDFIELSKEHSMVEMIATKKIAGRNLSEINVRSKYGCTIVAIQRQATFIISPSADEVIAEGDVLIVIGHNQDIAVFEEKGV
ncbi:TrkA family potassium uptake protein [Robertmurraya sp. DFI.2.37]|uniref:potassium channel family protein n=1 Tax=Robertmurraya sp. DFI.2.37 TaxID=3031819 RepID=UPI0012456FC5|nr:TrkA family potassium uptake protein [Robertmurraya sp. DFI.2.37]MDF1508847.1 TrkA family potassium uptake protein [Robertmurraya sp. DFI.2.37]